MNGLYARYQPEYAKRGVATFPCDIANKQPLVKNYLNVGNSAASALAHKFTEADAMGFVTGRRNQITVLDIDTDDARVLDRALADHGEARLIVQTASKKFHCYYRYDGEQRTIRPYGSEVPIDVLGERGFVMAPPSLFGEGQYQIVQGKIGDLDCLTPMEPIDVIKAQALDRKRQPLPREGQRNSQLWRHCMKNARHCDCFDDLLDVARTYNMQLAAPLEEVEVMKVANSAWGYEQSGNNRFGQFGAYLSLETVQQLATQNPDALALLSVLKANNGPANIFPIANAMAGSRIKLRRHRFAKARNVIVKLGLVRQVRRNGRRQAALYTWPIKSAEIEQ